MRTSSQVSAKCHSSRFELTIVAVVNVMKADIIVMHASGMPMQEIGECGRSQGYPSVLTLLPRRDSAEHHIPRFPCHSKRD